MQNGAFRTWKQKRMSAGHLPGRDETDYAGLEMCMVFQLLKGKVPVPNSLQPKQRGDLCIKGTWATGNLACILLQPKGFSQWESDIYLVFLKAFKEGLKLSSFGKAGSQGR